MKRIIPILFLLLIYGLSFAQDVNVRKERSKDKVIIGRQVYYVHIVKDGDSLYSLSKLYNVSQKEIAKENPEVFLGLKIGQALKIPYNKKNEEGSATADSNDFIYHRVKKGQTLYSLSRKYNVSQEDIIACNLNVRYGLNVRQIVKIPKSRDIVEAIQKYPVNEPFKDTVKITDQFIYHIVDQEDTELSLVEQYEITKDILLEYNPAINEGLKVGQILKILKVGDTASTTVLFKTDKETEDSALYKKRALIAYSDSVNFPECDEIKRAQREPFQIALLLPFYLERNDEKFHIDSSEVDDFGDKIYERVYYNPYYIYPQSLNFVEFYEGFLLAVDTLKKSGFSVNIRVYDTENDTNRIKDILNSPELETMNLIFGPVFKDEIKVVSRFSKENGIKMVSPFSDNLDFVEDNQNLFQVIPSYNAQIDEFAKFVSTFEDKNIVMVHNGDSLQYPNIQMVKDKIFANLSIDTLINNIQFKEVVFKDSISVLEHSLNKEIENIFVVPSNEEAFVTDVLTNLNTLKSFGNNIKVIGLSRWQRFRNIDPQYYFNLELCIVTPFFIDYHDGNVNDFIRKYRDTYNTEPDNYAIHGYDVGLFFLSALKKYGVHFENCVYKHKIDLLQANYRFIKWYEYSGFENVGVDMVKYDSGYTIYRSSYEKNDIEKYSYNLE